MSLTDPLALIKKHFRDKMIFSINIFYKCFPFHHFKIVCRKHLSHFEELNSKIKKICLCWGWGGGRGREGQKTWNPKKKIHYLAYKSLGYDIWTCTKFRAILVFIPVGSNTFSHKMHRHWNPQSQADRKKILYSCWSLLNRGSERKKSEE